MAPLRQAGPGNRSAHRSLPSGGALPRQTGERCSPPHVPRGSLCNLRSVIAGSGGRGVKQPTGLCSLARLMRETTHRLSLAPGLFQAVPGKHEELSSPMRRSVVN